MAHRIPREEERGWQMKDTITLRLEMFSSIGRKEPESIMRVAIDTDYGEYRNNYQKKEPPLSLILGAEKAPYDFYELELWRQRENKRKEYIDMIAKQLAHALYDKF